MAHPACAEQKKLSTLPDLCVPSLRRGHVNLLCIVPILTDSPRKESKKEGKLSLGPKGKQERKAAAAAEAAAEPHIHFIIPACANQHLAWEALGCG